MRLWVEETAVATGICISGQDLARVEGIKSVNHAQIEFGNLLHTKPAELFFKVLNAQQLGYFIPLLPNITQLFAKKPVRD